MNRLIFVLVACAVAANAGKLRKQTPQLDGRIVGGEKANIEDYPYQLSLEKYGSHSCGASILSAEWVITAAHCLSSVSDPSTVRFRAGSSIRGSGGSIHAAAEIFVHPDYDSWTTDYDYALVRVADKFEFSSSVQPIGLIDAEPSAGTASVVSGWGTLSSGGSLPSQLQRVEVPIVARNVCEEQYEDYGITARMICAGLIEGGKDACQGDSGGPLVCNGKLAGIVSWGVGCAYPGYSGIYTNVAEGLDWINSIAKF